MTKRNSFITGFILLFLASFVLTLLIASRAFSGEMTVATGGRSGFYHNGLFSTFSSKVKRFSDGEWECTRALEKGTDGTIQNIKLVQSGKADVGFAQLGGVIITGADVEVIGTVMYELAHLVAPKKGKVGDVDDLESKAGHSVGINSRSGSMVTFNIFKKYDKDYGNASVLDVSKSSRAIATMTRGELDAYFFVSAPGTKVIRRIIGSGLKFLDVDDSDFNDFKFNGRRLYEFVKVGKKQGYPKKFKTICVPAVIIANKQWLEDNEDVFDILFDACSATKQEVKVSRKLDYYPG